MKVLSRTELAEVSGGFLTISRQGYIIITEDSIFTFNGSRLNSSGQLYDTFTNTIYFDFSKDGDSCCFNGKLYTATKIDDGYFYTIANC